MKVARAEEVVAVNSLARACGAPGGEGPIAEPVMGDQHVFVRWTPASRSDGKAPMLWVWRDLD